MLAGAYTWEDFQVDYLLALPDQEAVWSDAPPPAPAGRGGVLQFAAQFPGMLREG